MIVVALPKSYVFALWIALVMDSGLTDSFRSRVALAAKMTPQQRVLAGLEQSELAIKVVESGIRQQNPTADEQTIARLLAERITLMEQIQNRTASKT